MKTWYRIRASRKSAEIRIYEEIGAWGVSAKRFSDDLAALGEIASIAVRINSPGGAVFDALAIHNALQRHPARVVVHIDGLCASAATIVALAGDEARMSENGRYMIHEPWAMIAGDSADMQRSAELLDSVADQIVGLYAARTGLPSAAIRDMMRAETWMTAAVALDHGFIDAVDAPLRIAAKAHDLSRFSNPPSEVTAMSEPETTAVTAADPPDDDRNDETEPTEQAPSAENTDPPPVEPPAIARACIDAGEADLIPALLSAPIDAIALHARIEQAAEVRRLCAMVRQPGRAAELIRAGLNPDQAKARLWDAMVAADRLVGEIDATPPPPTKKPAADPTALARAALAYQQTQKAAGVEMPYAEAVAHIAKTGVPQ